jgi:hypothetical protein
MRLVMELPVPQFFAQFSVDNNTLIDGYHHVVRRSPKVLAKCFSIIGYGCNFH